MRQSSTLTRGATQAQNFQNSLSTAIRRRGQDVTVYTTTHASTADGNLILKAATLAGESKALFLFDGAPVANAAAMGVYADVPVSVFALEEDAELFQQHGVLVDSFGQLWRIQSAPILQPFADVQLAVFFMATLLKTKPDGIP